MSEYPGPSRGWVFAWMSRIPQWVWDVAPVAVLAPPLLLLLVFRAHLTPGLLGLIALLALLARRRAPLAALGVTGLAAFVSIVLGLSVAALIVITVMVALYAVDTRSGRRTSLGASGVAFGGAVFAIVLATPDVPPPHLIATFIAPAALIMTVWLIGDNTRVRRAYIAGLEERARMTDARRLADARKAADDERSRIARELHDVVAHHVAVMAVQAGAARMLNENIDEQTRDQLRTIETTAHHAMSELRRLLGVLRRENGAATPAAPQPGLGQLGTLIDQVRLAGLPIELTVSGTLTGLPDWLDVSAYRIIQEALTNVLKHAGQVVTRVRVTRADREVSITVTNEASTLRPAGPSGDQPGHGLIGMRERAAMAGGELRAGPLAAGGFEVLARLPLDAHRVLSLETAETS